MLKKSLKWIGLILLFLVLGLTLVVSLRQHRHFDAPYPAIKASTDSTIIARGRYLVTGPAHCADCHGNPTMKEAVNRGEIVPLSGGFQFATPVGTIIAPNITSSAAGIAQLGDSTIARSLRYGVAHDGRALFNFMPFHNTSDDDLTAIISYLRTVPPSDEPSKPNTNTLIGRIVKAFVLKPAGPEGEVPHSVKPDSTIAYGKYLATNVSNCRGCHTQRDLMTGAFVGPDYAGGFILESAIDPQHFQCVSPNLSPEPATGHINSWTEDFFIKRFRAGKTNPHSQMPWGPFSRMSDLELKAIYRYLKQVEPIRNDPGPMLVKKK